MCYDNLTGTKYYGIINIVDKLKVKLSLSYIQNEKEWWMYGQVGRNKRCV